jgi:hypothetical protein
MGGIFYFSSRPDPLSFLPVAEQRGSVGKVAHFAEYAGLTALLYRALSNDNEGQTPPGSPDPADPLMPSKPGTTRVSRYRLAIVGHSSLVSFAIALVYAILDELHQELVPGRGFALADIGYDLAGTITALGLIGLWDHI